MQRRYRPRPLQFWATFFTRHLYAKGLTGDQILWSLQANMASAAYAPSLWGSRLAYCYLLRVPLLLGFALVGLPFAALINSSPLRALLENLFALDTGATFLSTVVAVVLAWSLVLACRVVFLNGELRFGVIQLIQQKNFPPWIWLVTV